MPDKEIARYHKGAAPYKIAFGIYRLLGVTSVAASKVRQIQEEATEEARNNEQFFDRNEIGLTEARRGQCVHDGGHRRKQPPKLVAVNG